MKRINKINLKKIFSKISNKIRNLIKKKTNLKKQKIDQNKYTLKGLLSKNKKSWFKYCYKKNNRLSVLPKNRKHIKYSKYLQNKMIFYANTKKIRRKLKAFKLYNLEVKEINNKLKTYFPLLKYFRSLKKQKNAILFKKLFNSLFKHIKNHTEITMYLQYVSKLEKITPMSSYKIRTIENIKNVLKYQEITLFPNQTLTIDQQLATMILNTFFILKKQKFKRSVINLNIDCHIFLGENDGLLEKDTSTVSLLRLTDVWHDDDLIKKNITLISVLLEISKVIEKYKIKGIYSLETKIIINYYET